MRKPSLRQINYATDISSTLRIPMPEQDDMSTYASYIASHLDDFYNQLDRNPARSRRCVYDTPDRMAKVQGVEPRLYLHNAGSHLSDGPVCTAEGAVKFMKNYMQGVSSECLLVLNLDNAGKAINYSRVAVGTINSTYASSTDIFKTALLSNAAQIMICHNHLTDNCLPSKPDRMMTATVAQAGWIMGISLVDHIIICNNPERFYSFKESCPSFLDDAPSEARYPAAVWEE